MYFLLASVMFLFGIALSEVCHIGSPREYGYEQSCGLQNAGCIMVRYDRDIQEYGSDGKNLNVHSTCMSKIQPLHPVFAVMDCAESHRHATCYDQNTPDLIEFELKSIGVLEQSIGEILKLHGMNRFCCCKGTACNKANDRMINFFSPGQVGLEPFKDTMDVSFYPGGSDQPTQRPHHHRHHQHGKPSSATALTACAFMSLFSFLL